MNFQTFLVNGELKLPNAQSTRVRFCLKTVISFPVWPTVYTDPVKTVPYVPAKILSRVEMVYSFG